MISLAARHIGAIALVVFCTHWPMGYAQEPTDAAAQSESLMTQGTDEEPVVDDILAALEDAERLMAEQDDLIDQARRHLKQPTHPEGMDAETPPSEMSVAYREETVEIEEEEVEETPQEVTEPVKEISSEEIKIEPPQKKKPGLFQRIDQNLKRHMGMSPPYARKFIPSEGILAYKVAASDGLITQDEAVEIAVKNSVKLQSLGKRVKASIRKLTEARRAFFPTVSGEIAVSGGFTNDTNYQGELWKLNLSQPLYDGGELLFTLRQQETVLKSDKAKFAKEKGEIIYKVGEAYNNLVNALYNLEYQEALLEEVTEIHDRTVKAFDEKLVSEIDHLDVVSTHGQVTFQKESAISSLLSAKLLLFQAMGVDFNEGLTVDTRLLVNEVPIDLDTVRELVRKNNWDIRIKELNAKAAYYQVKVNEAKTHPKVELRGYVGLAGEATLKECEKSNSPHECDTVEGAAPLPLDLEKENALFVEVKMPFGPNSVEYQYSRRVFGPTISTFGGAPQDWKHRARFFLLDKLSELTDTEKDIAEYLNVKYEWQKEMIDQDVKANEAYYEYRGALLQMTTSEAKMKYREKYVASLRFTTGLEEASLSTLLSEMVQLSEDKYSYVKAVSDVHNAISDINRLIGIEGYYGSESG